MSVRSVEQQLKKNNWTHNFKQPAVLNQLLQEASQIIPRGRQIMSLTYGNQIRSNGGLSDVWWIIILTNREIIMVESLLDQNRWRGNPKMISFEDIKLINGKTGRSNQQQLRINIVTSTQSWTFETLDLESGLHFVDQAEASIVEGFHDLATVLKTQELNNLEIIDARQKPKKYHKLFNYFFNFNSLLKSVPSLQVLFIICQSIWLICDIVFIGLWGSHKITIDACLGLGLVMIIFNVFSMLWVGGELINAWEKHTINKTSQSLVLREAILLLSLVIACLVTAHVDVAGTFTIVGLFFNVLIISDASLQLTKGILEIGNPIATNQFDHVRRTR